MRILRLAALLLLAGGASAALAQLRTIPPEARTARMEHVQDMYILIDGAPRRLAPGAQIRDAANRLMLPVSIPAGSLVKYLTDAEGMVRQVWILTPQEAEPKRSGQAEAR